MRKWMIAVLVAALGIAVAVTVVAARDKPAATFRVLNKARSAQSDALPPLQGMLADLVVPGTARSVGSLGGKKAFVASGTDGRTCFLMVDDFGTGGGCIGQQSLRDAAHYVGEGTGETVDLLIPVPDAYTDVEIDGKEFRAANNVVLTTVDKKNAKLKVKGASGTLEGDLLLAASK